MIVTNEISKDVRLDAPAKLTAREKSLARVWQTAPWLALGGVTVVPPALFLLVYLLSGFSAIFLVLAITSAPVSLIMAVIVALFLLMYRRRWTRDLRDRLASDGITADEVGFFLHELTSGEKRSLREMEKKQPLLADAYRETLAQFGHTTTTEYVARACEIAISRDFLPHTNAGVLSKDEMRLLKPVNASLGLMLENVSPRLSQKGMPHFSAPDKHPEVRLRMIREAGELSIPFTTGILIGIGETREERVDSLLAIRRLHETYGHIQEVIIQNFRAKPNTRMAGYAEPDATEIARTTATARLILGGSMNIQVPPNLNPNDHHLMLRSGINDWGGISPVTRDYVNPEAAWPHLDILAETCRAAGFTLRERLAIYDEYIDTGNFLPARLRSLAGNLQANILQGGV